MSYQALIGFSGKIASGKTSTSQQVMKQIFEEGDYKIISFADALRTEVNEILDIVRTEKNPQDAGKQPIFELVEPEDLEKVFSIIWNTAKENPNLTAKSKTKEIRYLLQYWGTNIRRKSNNNYWVNKLMNRVRELHYSGYHVCVDDVRFTNEATQILLNDGQLIRINIDEELQGKRILKRDGKFSPKSLQHHSETVLDDFPWFTITYTAKENEDITQTTNIISEKLKHNIQQQEHSYNHMIETIKQLQ